jgi:predicted transcriptional regulator
VSSELDRAAASLGPLEGRIMRVVWTGHVPAAFVVRDVHALMPELAYTTVMTTLRRLAGKDLLTVRAGDGRRAHEYRAAGTPGTFLAAASAREAGSVVDRYGEAALAAFAARLDALTPEQRRRLEELRE